MEAVNMIMEWYNTQRTVEISIVYKDKFGSIGTAEIDMVLTGGDDMSLICAETEIYLRVSSLTVDNGIVRYEDGDFVTEISAI